MDKNTKVIGQYKNGNYWVYMMSDGTKIRYTDDDKLSPEFPECIDLCITKRCSQGCQFCYENCLPKGKCWNYEKNKTWVESLKPYTELAINGNDWYDIDGLDAFLIKMRERNVLVNATFHFDQYAKLVDNLKTDYQEDNMLHGIGISVNKIYNHRDLLTIRRCDNTVVHLVAGIFNKEMFDAFKEAQNYMDNVMHSPYKFKILILGYKDMGRGNLYKHLYSDEVRENMEWLSQNIDEVMDAFEIVSFDNLALEQLDIRNKVSEDVWKSGYMGDDGQFTMYIDGVDCMYAVNSVTPGDQRCLIAKNDTICDIFKKVHMISESVKLAEDS